MPIRALIADDHELFRSGLKQLLVDVLSVEDVREAETLDQAIDMLTNDGAGDLILVDLRMPGMEFIAKPVGDGHAGKLAIDAQIHHEQARCEARLQRFCGFGFVVGGADVGAKVA